MFLTPFFIQDPNLWYGIGILYDRYGSYEYAEEAFSAVLKMYPHFEKSNEIYFRLGMVFKQQGFYDQSLEVGSFSFLFFFFLFFSFLFFSFLSSFGSNFPLS